MRPDRNIFMLGRPVLCPDLRIRIFAETGGYQYLTDMPVKRGTERIRCWNRKVWIKNEIYSFFDKICRDWY